MNRFGILLFEGCEELDAFGPFEVLSCAYKLGADFEVKLGTLEPMKEVRLAYGTRIVPDALEPKAGDWVIVPGGGWINHSVKGTWSEVQRGDLPRRLAEWKKKGVFLASVCTGAMLLAAAGLLNGRRATTHHLAQLDLEGVGIDFVEAKVVDEGDIVTAGGITSGIELGIWLTERFAGAEIAQRLKQHLEYQNKFKVLR